MKLQRICIETLDLDIQEVNFAFSANQNKIVFQSSGYLDNSS